MSTASCIVVFCALWKGDEEKSSLSELVIVYVCNNHVSVHVVDTYSVC